MKCHVLLFALLVAASCNNDPAPLTAGQYCNRFAEEVCAAVSPACLIPETSCISAQVAQCVTNAQQPVGQLPRDFVPANAEGCLRKVDEIYGKLKQGEVALKANDIQAVRAACDRVYQGSSAVNGPCAADADCLGNLICDKDHCGNRTYRSQGEGCANVGETCRDGYYCGASGGLLMCVPKLGPQTDCSAAPCMESLRCSAGVCLARLGYGELCTADGDCTSNFCEPYAGKCADDVRFANGSAACLAMGGT